MKLFAVLMLVCALGLITDTARAQEARLDTNVDAVGVAQPVPRTPTLVLVNETVKPTLDAKASVAQKPQAAKGATAKAATPATPTMVVTQPIVMQSGAILEQTAEHVIETTGNPKYDEYIKQAAAHN